MKYLNLKPVEFDALGKRTQQAFRWEGRILLPKYDGCFAMVAFWNGKPSYVMSRTGEDVKSMGHIGDELLSVYPWLASSQGGVMVLGEAWIPGEEFSIIGGIFRRQRPQLQIGFAPFDLVHYHHDDDDNFPTLYSEDPYRQRVNMLRRGPLDTSRMIFPPVPVTCESRDYAEGYARQYKAMGGYDGAICSDPNATYTPGAGKGGEFIKLKPLLSYSVECIGYVKDIGEKTGRDTCALEVRVRDGKTCKVATGLTEDQQANPEQFVGRTIEVEVMGWTSGGLFREPRFKGVRDDATPDF